MASTFVVYQDNRGEYRWRLRENGNHEIIAVSGEGYTTKYSCKRAIKNVQDEGPDAGIIDITG